jgi:hypothetical protein
MAYLVGAASCRDLDEMRIDFAAESRSHGTQIPQPPLLKGGVSAF